MEAKRTKIVCTIGPASSSVSMLTRMIRHGMNVARLNFSHGTHAEHQQLLRHIRKAAKDVGTHVAILQDLQGPKIRVGVLPAEGVVLRKSQKIQFTTATDVFHPGKPLPVTYKQLHLDVKKDHRILLDDGRMEVVVQSVRGKVVTGKVVFGGVLTSHKGMNLPDSTVSAAAFTAKDREDALFGLSQEVDWVALSFVTSAKVVREVRRFLQEHARIAGVAVPKIIVKIERKEGVQDFVDILSEADGIMIARGDLGVEIPLEEVPVLQKEFVEICRQAGKPVIVATQMLDSMSHSPRPTRAEASDVANAVMDHADALMLSQETATGEFPDEAVEVMTAIICEAEKSRMDDIGFYQIHSMEDAPTAIAHTVHILAENDQIDAIVTSAEYGRAAFLLNVFRPNVPIFMACRDDVSLRQSILRAGIEPFVEKSDAGSFIQRSRNALIRKKKIRSTDRIAFVVVGTNASLSLTIVPYAS